MSSTLQHLQNDVQAPTASDDQKSLAALYDEHAAVVLGFLEKLADDKDQAEELLQAVFLALPAQLHNFDPEKGRFVVWLLKLARTIAGRGNENPDFKTNGKNVTTNTPIRDETANVHSRNAGKAPAANDARPLTGGKEKSPARMIIQSDGIVELLYVKGYTFAQAAAELGVNESNIQLLVRTELKKYRRS